MRQWANEQELVPLLKAIYKGIQELGQGRRSFGGLRDLTLQSSTSSMGKNEQNTRTDSMSDEKTYTMSDDELTQRSVAYLTGKGF